MSLIANMNPWLKASTKRALPYALYLVLFGVSTLIWSIIKTEFPDHPFQSLLGLAVMGGSIGAAIALWRLAMAFAPDARFTDGSVGYIDVEDDSSPQPLVDQLIHHAKRLRLIAVSHEKHRRNVTIIGVSIAVASLSIPVATWTVILLDAFRKEQTMPNAWLLVISSATTGALGLAIAVTLLRHLKNNQRPLAEISQRTLLCIEASIALRAGSLPESLSLKALDATVQALIRPPSLASVPQDVDAKDESDTDKKLLASLLSAFRMRD